MSQVKDAPKVWVCDCCSSWTDRPVSREELSAEWGWGFADDDGNNDEHGEYVYCSECA